VALSAHGEPLVGLEVVEKGGYGVVKIRGLYGANGSQSTIWTSDDTGDAPKRLCSPHPDDSISALHLKSQGDYGIVDVSFTTRKGYSSGWFTKNTDASQTFDIPLPDGVVVGLVGRTWGGHGLMDLQLVLQAATWVPGSAYGGSGGAEFADDVTGVRRLAGLVIRSGDSIDAIQATYERDNGTTFAGPRHGGTSGGEQTITFATDEVITEISGHVGKGFGADVLRQLVIKTNKRPAGYGPYGKADGKAWTFNAASVGQDSATFRVGGIFGRAGNAIDRIGFFYHSTP
jgi:hypothetical protein